MYSITKHSSPDTTIHFMFVHVVFSLNAKRLREFTDLRQSTSDILAYSKAVSLDLLAIFYVSCKSQMYVDAHYFYTSLLMLFLSKIAVQ